MKKKMLAALMGLVLCIGAAGCAKDAPKEMKTAETARPETVEETEPDEYEDDEFEDAYEDEYEDDEFEDAYEEDEEEEDPEDEEEDVEEEEEGMISYDDVMESYDKIVELYSYLEDLYGDEKIPLDEGMEKEMAEISEQIFELQGTTEDMIPTDEDKIEVLQKIDNIEDELNQLINALISYVESESQYFDEVQEVVNKNYDYMQSYFESCWDYVSQNGGTDNEVEALIQARDDISEINSWDPQTSSDLQEMNDRILFVIEWLSAMFGD